MDWKLEVVVIPVTDVDRAKEFYTGRLGFHLDADTRPTETMRVVHMTPPGSACSVVIGPKVAAAGTDLGSTARLQLVVPDIEAAREPGGPQARQRGTHRRAGAKRPHRPGGHAGRGRDREQGPATTAHQRHHSTSPLGACDGGKNRKPILHMPR